MFKLLKNFWTMEHRPSGGKDEDLSMGWITNPAPVNH